MNPHLAVLHQPAVQLLVLVLGAYRITRLLGWDDWPPIVAVRRRVLGERWILIDEPQHEAADSAVYDFTADPVPGKPPSTEVANVRPAYDRPTLAHLVHCPFCLSWWTGLAVYGAWWVDARWTLILLAPWALAAAAALIAKQLDP